LVTGFVSTEQTSLDSLRSADHRHLFVHKPVWVSSIAAWMLMADASIRYSWQKLRGSCRKASACSQRPGAGRNTPLAEPAQTRQTPIEAMLTSRSCRRGGSYCSSAAATRPPHLHRRNIRPNRNPGHPREMVIRVQRNAQRPASGIAGRQSYDVSELRAAVSTRTAMKRSQWHGSISHAVGTIRSRCRHDQSLKLWFWTTSAAERR
jgi:hypothetical protein